MPMALLVLALVGVLAVLLNVQTLRAGQGAELTTSAAMPVTCLADVLCGQGHTISPAAVMVLATALLAWKERLAGFSAGLTESEMRSALLLAILAIVIYPALPTGAVGPWNLVEPRAAWVTVILIAGIGFINYILWKLYGTRGTELSGFLGGLLNSNFTVIELSSRVVATQGAYVSTAYRGILLASAVLVLWSYRRGGQPPDAHAPEIKLGLPFSLPLALKYGAVFLVLHIVGGLTQRHFGDAGFYFVSVVGGLMSSASAVAAAATLASQGSLSPTTAGTGAVLASLTSIAFSMSFVLRTRERRLTVKLCTAMLCIAAAGAVGPVGWHFIVPMLQPG